MNKLEIQSIQKKIIISMLLSNPELFQEIRQLCREMEAEA